VSNLPLVGVIMGSDSDLPVMQGAIDVLVDFGVPHEVRIISAHRTPDEMFEYARAASERGLSVIIAGAGGAAHLPGMTASMTTLPVIGVPIPLQQFDGLDALLSIAQMPAGVPVATVAIGNARNAGLLAVRILGTHDEKLRTAMERYQGDLAQTVRDKDARVREQY
jgi:5-(carboxyamino)imidazole ribonucleotide mutase